MDNDVKISETPVMNRVNELKDKVENLSNLMSRLKSVTNNYRVEYPCIPEKGSPTPTATSGKPPHSAIENELSTINMAMRILLDDFERTINTIEA